MKKLLLASLLLLSTKSAFAFCGFYVAKADTGLFNQSSKVVIVRDENRTVLTMANDFQGEPKEFAIVIPVPTFLEKEQIHVTENKYIDHLDAYTAPRLVEYFDENPCDRVRLMKAMSFSDASLSMIEEEADELGVTVEASYTIGEYDILILSAEESDGLETWLKQNDYKSPDGASNVLGSYIKQGMRFFVAKVNLEEQAKLGYTYLRPLQVAYESPKFMLPVRLGTLNAQGDQDLFAFILSKKGRVEAANYRTVKLPTGMDLPVMIKDQFADFYKDMFATQAKKENNSVIFQEYAWDMAWCDPCVADPLNRDELRELGVFWLKDGDRKSPAQNVYVTRLHARYNAETFPEDIVFQQTSDKTNFQGRYVLRHKWEGDADCPEAKTYRSELSKRHEKEAQTLANLTGWDVNQIRYDMGYTEPIEETKPQDPKPEPWWKGLWR